MRYPFLFVCRPITGRSGPSQYVRLFQLLRIGCQVAEQPEGRVGQEVAVESARLVYRLEY